MDEPLGTLAKAALAAHGLGAVGEGGQGGAGVTIPVGAGGPGPAEDPLVDTTEYIVRVGHLYVESAWTNIDSLQLSRPLGQARRFATYAEVAQVQRWCIEQGLPVELISVRVTMSPLVHISGIATPTVAG